MALWLARGGLHALDVFTNLRVRLAACDYLTSIGVTDLPVPDRVPVAPVGAERIDPARDVGVRIIANHVCKSVD